LREGNCDEDHYRGAAQDHGCIDTEFRYERKAARNPAELLPV